MILYFANRDFTVLGQASTSMRDGYTVTDDTRKEAVDTAVASLDATISYTDGGRLALEGMCKAGNYILAYDGDKEPASTACYMIVSTEQSVTDRTLTVYAEDSGLDLLNNLAEAYKGTATMTAGDYVRYFLEGTGFELASDTSTASAKACEWTDTETVSKRLLDVCDKFSAELTYGFDVEGMAITRRWVALTDAVGEDKNVNLYIDREVNNITVKGSVENLATALMPTGKDNLTLKGFNVPSADAERYEVDGYGNLIDTQALEKWHRADGETGNLYQKYDATDISNQADLYNAAKEKLASLADVVTTYEVDIAILPDGVGLGDRVNVIDDKGELYISGRILELETSVTNGTIKATLGEYLVEESGISDTVTKLASQFAELSKVRELYTWIAYADNENGDGITTDPTGKAYMGTATNKTIEEPKLEAKLYKWVKVKGDQGEPGEDGATGPQGPQGEKGDIGATGPQGDKGDTGDQGPKGEKGATGDKGDPGADGVSPVVTLETKSGTTAIKVTDVEGTKETELIDGTARADASTAQTTANSAKTTAETANSTATDAKDKANLANSTAEVAKNTADNAGKVATAAKTTADSASKTASDAQTTANSANVTANSAKTTADKAQEDLNATNATIKDLQAADATISGKVTAAEADINSVKADYVKASELDTKVASIANAEIGKATIKDAQIESINGNKIIDGSIVAAALSHEVVKNFRNNNIYYQAEAPEGEDLKEGDLWYKSLTKTSGDRAGILFVYDGSGWVNKPFDSESILAKSITAAEIATGTITSSQLAAHTITANEIEAGTITAKEMNMENLQTNIARVGASDGKHLDILSDGIEIKDGSKQLAKYGDTVVIGDEEKDNIHIDGHGVTIRKADSILMNIQNDVAEIASENINDICDIVPLEYVATEAVYKAISTYPLLTKGDMFTPYICYYKYDVVGAGNLRAIMMTKSELPYSSDLNWTGTKKMEISITKADLDKFCDRNGVDIDDLFVMMSYAMQYNGTALTIGARNTIGALANTQDDNSIAIGWGNIAGQSSVAIGTFSFADNASIACGYDSYANGESLAIGTRAEALQVNSAAIGDSVSVTDPCQLVIGMKNATYNADDNAALVVGNGTSSTEEDLARESNAAIITNSGDLRLAGTVYTGCNNDSTGGKSIIDLIYPVGSIYMSVNGTSPSTLFGGTWERIQDRFLLAAGDTYAAGKADGSPDAVVVSHTHTQNKHSHTPSNGDGYMSYTSGSAERVKVSTSSGTRYAIVGKKSATSADASGLRYSDGTSSATPTINATGTSGKGANMPPYLAVYIWKRTA